MRCDFAPTGGRNPRPVDSRRTRSLIFNFTHFEEEREFKKRAATAQCPTDSASSPPGEREGRGFSQKTVVFHKSRFTRQKRWTLLSQKKTSAHGPNGHVELASRTKRAVPLLWESSRPRSSLQEPMAWACPCRRFWRKLLRRSTCSSSWCRYSTVCPFQFV